MKLPRYWFISSSRPILHIFFAFFDFCLCGGCRAGLGSVPPTMSYSPTVTDDIKSFWLWVCVRHCQGDDVAWLGMPLSRCWQWICRRQLTAFGQAAQIVTFCDKKPLGTIFPGKKWTSHFGHNLNSLSYFKMWQTFLVNIVIIFGHILEILPSLHYIVHQCSNFLMEDKFGRNWYYRLIFLYF